MALRWLRRECFHNKRHFWNSAYTCQLHIVVMLHAYKCRETIIIYVIKNSQILWWKTYGFVVLYHITAAIHSRFPMPKTEQVDELWLHELITGHRVSHRNSYTKKAWKVLRRGVMLNMGFYWPCLHCLDGQAMLVISWKQPFALDCNIFKLTAYCSAGCSIAHSDNIPCIFVLTCPSLSLSLSTHLPSILPWLLLIS